ncbi:MAG: hypothetical protein EOS07_24700 [Mesorhizobium sp.]|nr:MAG: hypothetical protein EOS07_24700 [Mesorhizobium sp.]
MLESAMSSAPSISDTLRVTHAMLKAARKAVADGGHIEDLREIDALVGVAQAETERRLEQELRNSAR